MYHLMRWLAWLFFKVIFRLEVHGRHHIPRKGPVLLYANHLSNWDPPILAVIVPRRVHFMAKEELFRNPLLAMLIRAFGAFPVKRGTADVGAVKRGLQILRDGGVFILFPEGHRSKTGKLGKPFPGAALFALKTEVTPVPVLLSGTYRLFGKVKVTVLPPVDVSSLPAGKAGSKQLEEVAELMMEPLRNAQALAQTTSPPTSRST